MKISYVHIILFLVFSSSLNGQTCCSAGAALGASYGIHNSTKRALNFSLDYQYNSVNRLIDNNKLLTNDPRSRFGQRVLIQTDFVFNPSFAFRFSLPLIGQSRKTFSESQHSQGIGDLSFVSQFSRKLNGSQILKISGGIELPTGQVFIQDSRGIVLSPDMQSGSGTWDYFTRIAFENPTYTNNNLSSIHSISFRYNGFNNHFGDPTREAGRSFKFGNETFVTSLWSYTFQTVDWTLTPQTGLSLRYTTANIEEQQSSPNSGGMWLNLPLSFSSTFKKKYTISFHGEIPIYQQLNGLQITTDYSAGVKIAYLFSISKKESNPYKIDNLEKY